MKHIALLTIIPALLIGCGAANDPTDLELSPSELSFELINCPAVSGNSSVEEEQIAVINDPHEFRELYLASNPHSQEEAPEVNFDDKTVIAIHLGAMSSSGYSVDVMEVRERDDIVNVQYRVNTPSSECEEDAAVTYPYCFVSIDKTDKEFEFFPNTSFECTGD